MCFSLRVGGGWGILTHIEAKHAILVQLELLLLVQLHYANLLLMSLEVLTTLLVTLNETNSDLQFEGVRKRPVIFRLKKNAKRRSAERRAWPNTVNITKSLSGSHFTICIPFAFQDENFVQKESQAHICTADLLSWLPVYVSFCTKWFIKKSTQPKKTETTQPPLKNPNQTNQTQNPLDCNNPRKTK